MINKSELRIGNYVERTYHDGKKEFDKVNGYTFWHYEHLDEAKHFVEVDCLNPILLTAEILEACCFKEGLENNFNSTGFRSSKYNYLSLFRIWIEPIGKRVFVFYDQSIRIEKKYLHELQNLYFILTGEELTVNLTEKKYV